MMMLPMNNPLFNRISALIAMVSTALWSTGCGTTKSYTATEQLLISDAVDATVATLDFAPLAGKDVYLDTTFFKTHKSSILVDSDYVISSLRQQMVAAGVHLTDSRDEAQLIAEARLGALGIDGHTVTYGLPASSALSSASTALSGSQLLPSIPEIAFARKEAKSGAAKVAVFAYERESKRPYWQSGIARSASNARDTWILGIGPWQRGTIYEGTQFAGTRFSGTELIDAIDIEQSPEDYKKHALDSYRRGRLFAAPGQSNSENGEDAPSLVVAASAVEKKKGKDADAEKKSDKQ